MSRGRTRSIGVPRPRGQTPEEAERARSLRLLHEEAAKRRREEEKDEALKKAPVGAREPERAPGRTKAKPADLATARKEQAAPPARVPKRRQAKSAASPPSRAPAAPRDESYPKPPAKARAEPRKPKPVRANARPVRLLPTPLPEPPCNPLRAAIDQFLFDRTIRQCTPMTLSGYRYDLAGFARFLEAQAVERPEEITPQHIRLYLHDFYLRNLSAWTIVHRARSVRAFCNFLLDEELISKSPMAKMSMPRLPKQILPAFTVDEVRRLLDAAETSPEPARERAIVLALVDTGCRASEFVALTVGDVDSITGKVMVRQGKGRKDRVTFLGERALAAVRAYLGARRRPAKDAALWRARLGGSLTTSGLRRVLRRLGQRAGVPDVHPHKFRRTFAIWSLRAGMNIYSLQALMGHSDLKMLQRYLALVEADLEAQHREHGAVDTML